MYGCGAVGFQLTARLRTFVFLDSVFGGVAVAISLRSCEALF